MKWRSLLVALVPIHVLWSYDGIPPGMLVYSLKPGEHELWETKTVHTLVESPAASPLPDSRVELAPGTSIKVALVYHNTSDRPQRFFAAPHHVAPLHDSFGFKFKCLCTNHVYEVEPGDWWYRVVEIRLSEDFTGKELEIEHLLVALPAAKQETKP